MCLLEAFSSLMANFSVSICLSVLTDGKVESLLCLGEVGSGPNPSSSSLKSFSIYVRSVARGPLRDKAIETS